MRTLKELEKEVEKLKKENQKSKQEQKEQINKWNKITALASVALAIASALNLLVSFLVYCRGAKS